VTLKDSIETIRHSTAHVLAMAIQTLWPEARLAIGPIITDGFYYDFHFPKDVKINEEHFPEIEAEMTKIIQKNFQITRKAVSRKEAEEFFIKQRENFKVELVQNLPEQEDVTFYYISQWVDLCRGPHVASTKQVGVFKLMRVAGAYWRGDEKKPMLTRIYGTAWKLKKDLRIYLSRLEEAKKRDHRLLGKQQNLFSFHKEASGAVFFHPHGAFLYNRLLEVMRKSNEHYGYKEVITPLIMDLELWHRSGHYENYRHHMYFTTVDHHEAAVKPMNCPGHILIYQNERRSYRELPFKLAEFGRVHRYEPSGTLHGLFRVRTFVQDDAHTFCSFSQVIDQVSLNLEQITSLYRRLGFEQFEIELSTRPQKSIGSKEMWDTAEISLKQALENNKYSYKINSGDGAFYGPKIDFHLIDCLGRRWQCGTIQLDFSMPDRFDLSYRDPDDTPQRPVLIHRAVFGSIERFLAILIEHCNGHFPLWLAPVQVKLLTLTEKHIRYAEGLGDSLLKAGFRVEKDFRYERLGYKIREAQLLKIPHILIIGDKELENQTISVRKSLGKQQSNLTLSKLIDELKECEQGCL